jgi:hypothetical protein
MLKKIRFLYTGEMAGIKKIILFLFSIVFFFGCDKSSNINNNEAVRGSGRVVSQTRSVEDCSGITIRNLGNIYLTQGTEQSIRIEADDNIINDVISRKVDGNLLVGLEDGNYSNITLRIYVTLKDIESITINGAGNVASQNSFECDNMNCTINGAGNINLKGNGNRLDCVINGAGNINAEEFIVEECRALINGAGVCVVYATNELNAAVNGAGTIYYSGNPSAVRTSVSGVGQIVRR